MPEENDMSNLLKILGDTIKNLADTQTDIKKSLDDLKGAITELEGTTKEAKKSNESREKSAKEKNGGSSFEKDESSFSPSKDMSKFWEEAERKIIEDYISGNTELREKETAIWEEAAQMRVDKKKHEATLADPNASKEAKDEANAALDELEKRQVELRAEASAVQAEGERATEVQRHKMRLNAGAFSDTYTESMQQFNTYIEDLKKQREFASEDQKDAINAKIREAQDAKLQRKLTASTMMEESGSFEQMKKGAEARRKFYHDQAEELSNQATEILMDLTPLSEDATDEEKKAHDAEIEKARNLQEQANAYKQAEADAATAEAISKKIESSLSDAFNQLTSALTNGVDNAIDDILSHRTKTMARLQGYTNGFFSMLDGEYAYAKLMDTVQGELAVSPFVSQKQYLAKLDEAVEKGIAYNIEQRTFLATVSDKIATTFDAFDSNLLRLIKLQQADSTAARLGMEAALTKTLNGMFSDTSYLSNLYDTVAGALIDAESIMSRDNALEFEYAVQKWMSALSSLGMSDNAITQIVNGVNSIATGNVQALNGNSSVNTLMAMASQRAGLDYAKLLVDGLNASDTNKLLKSVVEYLQTIADESGNNVVRSAYGDVYSLAQSDFRAVSSLTDKDISNIFSQSMSYSKAMSETQSQLSYSVGKRMTTGEKIQNLVENLYYTTAEGIANNAVSYAMWEVTNLLQDTIKGIPIGFINVFGSGIDLNTDLATLLRTGIMGASMLSNIDNVVSSIKHGNGLNLSYWGGDEYTKRGGDFNITNGFESTTSESTYVASGSSDDMQKSALSGATEDAEDTSEITNANTKAEHTFDDFYTAVYEDKKPLPVVIADEISLSDIYIALFEERKPVLSEIDLSGDIWLLLSRYMYSAVPLLPEEKIYTASDIYKEIFENGSPIVTMPQDKHFDAHDLYSAMYLDQTPVPVQICKDGDVLTKISSAMMALSSEEKIMNVIVSNTSEKPMYAVVNGLGVDLEKDMKDFIAKELEEQLPQKVKSVTLGYGPVGSLSEDIDDMKTNTYNVKVDGSSGSSFPILRSGNNTLNSTYYSVM